MLDSNSMMTLHKVSNVLLHEFIITAGHRGHSHSGLLA